MRNARIYLQDILDAITSIEAFVEGMDLDAFRQDDRTASAVIRKFEIIGEATKNIPDSLRATTPEIPWRAMAGMRDRLIHGYYQVDYQLVWRTIQERLPVLKPLLEDLLARHHPGGASNRSHAHE